MIRDLLPFSVPLSIDTYKVEIARAALDLGVSLVNDVSGGKQDHLMLTLIAEYDVPMILMHNPLKSGELPHASRITQYYAVDAIYSQLQQMAEYAQQYGIKKDNIILDPGICFRKDLECNLEILLNLALFSQIGYKTLLGASNKAFIGKILRVEKLEERIEGTLAITALAALAGIDIVLVHDVAANSRVLQMVNAIYGHKTR